MFNVSEGCFIEAQQKKTKEKKQRERKRLHGSAKYEWGDVEIMVEACRHENVIIIIKALNPQYWSQFKFNPQLYGSNASQPSQMREWEMREYFIMKWTSSSVIYSEKILCWQKKIVEFTAQRKKSRNL